LNLGLEFDKLISGENSLNIKLDICTYLLRDHEQYKLGVIEII
jgi:hypothetical protein